MSAINNNVFNINTIQYNKIEQEYMQLIAEFNRLSKIQAENLSSEENMLMQILVLLISHYQEQFDLTKHNLYNSVGTKLLAA
jgi:hypothetical protein